MGIFFPRINSTGAVTGFIMSFFILLIIKFYTPVSFLLYGFLGIMFSIIIAYFVSLIFYSDKKDLKGLSYKSLND